MFGKTGRLLLGLLLLLTAAGRAQADALCLEDIAAEGVYHIDQPGVYEIMGKAADLQLRIEVARKERVTLVLRDAQWACSRGAAVYVQSGDVTVDLREGTSRIAGGSEEEPAAIYAMDDLTLQGNASLQVEGSARNGIECRDELTIHSGELQVCAVWDGIRGRDHLAVLGGDIWIDAGNDGLKANNDKDPGMGNVCVSGGEIRIAAGDDALHAQGRAQVLGGTLLVERCFEGIEGSCVEIGGGDIRIKADDDGINATQKGEDVCIAGGDIRVDAMGDGIDSAGAIVLRGGRLAISASTSPRNSALDYMETSRAEGTELFAFGSAAMAQAPKSVGELCTVRIYFDSMQCAGQMLSLQDAQGKLLLACSPAKDYQAVVIAHPALSQGMTVSVYQGGEVPGLQPGEIAEQGDVQGAQRLCTLALEDVLLSVDEHGNPCDFVANSFGW